MPIRKVGVSGSVSVVDHETFGSNQRETEPIQGLVIANTQGVGSELVKMAVGVGGEVRVELELTASADASSIAHINGVAKLFEGDDENAQDLEHEERILIQVLPNEPRNHEVHLRNSGFGGGDKADITLTFTNTEANLDVAAGDGSIATPVSLMARHSGQVLDVAGASTSNGAPLIQFPANGQTNQRFRLEPVGDGLVRLVVEHSGLVLDVAGASTDHGAPLIQFPANGQANQHFRLEPVGDGFVRIVAQHSGQVLDVAGASLDNGAPIIQFPWNGHANQQWQA